MIGDWVSTPRNMFQASIPPKFENNSSVAATQRENIPTTSIMKYNFAPPLVWYGIWLVAQGELAIAATVG